MRVLRPAFHAGKGDPAGTGRFNSGSWQHAEDLFYRYQAAGGAANAGMGSRMTAL